MIVLKTLALGVIVAVIMLAWLIAAALDLESRQ